jgi:hypothetical protein
MQRSARLLILSGFALLFAGCAPARPPAELAGLWSAGLAACAAGVGVRFEPDVIEVVYEDGTETLFDRPHYVVESADETFRVRITYQLPRVAGGARVAGAHGVVVLARQPSGGIAPLTHSLVDARTGSARLRIANDPAVTALTLSPCGAHPWREDLRGRT